MQHNGNPLPLPGSDRYGILFHVATRTYPDHEQTPIAGLFVHVKNTDADPGTQIAALCWYFPGHIIFGDLNIDIRKELKRQSLVAAICRTHTLKYHSESLLYQDGTPYFTHYKKGDSNRLNGKSTLDYALVPNGFAEYVSISGFPKGGVAYQLDTNGSDHAVMMMRIQCQ